MGAQADLNASLSWGLWAPHPADTPEKLAVVESLRQRRVLVYPRPEGLDYVWPDARFCRCVYVGDEPRDQTYARLGPEQKLERERETAAKEREAAAPLTRARQFGWGLGWCARRGPVRPPGQVAASARPASCCLLARNRRRARRAGGRAI